MRAGVYAYCIVEPRTVLNSTHEAQLSAGGIVSGLVAKSQTSRVPYHTSDPTEHLRGRGGLVASNVKTPSN